MFLEHLVRMGGFELVHHWRGIDILLVLECALIAALICAVLSVAPRLRKRLRIAALVGLIGFSTAAYAANTMLSNLSASGALAGTHLIYVVATAGAGGVKATMTQVATYINSLFSGDATVASGGAVTLATVNGNVGSFGSATAAPTFTVNAKGLITAAGSATVTPAVGSITGLGAGCATWLATPSSANLATCMTDETGTGANVFANSPTLVTPNLGTPSALVLTNATGLPLAQLTGAGTGVLSALAAAMNSSTGPIGALTPTNNNCVTGNGTAWTSAACPSTVVSAVPSVQTGTNYAIVDGDRAKVIYLSNASPQTPTLPSAATLTSSNGWFVTICNINAGIQTVTPTTSTIGGAASLAIPGGSAARPVCWNAVSDGTNYSLVPAGNNNTIASGTSALGTGAISSATCATVVTTSAPGVATTDVVLASFNGDPTAVTGYVPLTSGMLTIIGYPTANNVNFKVCNNTGSSITPGAITLNWRVNR